MPVYKIEVEVAHQGTLHIEAENLEAALKNIAPMLPYTNPSEWVLTGWQLVDDIKELTREQG